MVFTVFSLLRQGVWKEVLYTHSFEEKVHLFTKTQSKNFGMPSVHIRITLVPSLRPFLQVAISSTSGRIHPCIPVHQWNIKCLILDFENRNHMPFLLTKAISFWSCYVWQLFYGGCLTDLQMVLALE